VATLVKNATEILDGTAALIVAVAAFVIGWTALMLPIVIGAAMLDEPSTAVAIGEGLALCGTAFVIGIHFGTARHFRIPAAFGLAFPLGYTVAACLACYSVLAHFHGRITWKGGHAS
jgi:hypothetical protein